MSSIDLFYDYFITRHGIKVFDDIMNVILAKIKDAKAPIKENMNIDEFYNMYVIFVFEIAVTDYWGFSDEQIVKYIQATIGKYVATKLSITRAKMIHKDTIQEIQKYLKQTTEKVFNSEGGIDNGGE